ncbi:MAG: hypothetical protein HQM04_18095 [Magnetococcales bacterium]|nr:hypothetical protein [Magnetococcales bacterium]MBF0116939.1 hypothetical protein [Magnetococcales bacterium]
MTIATFDTLEYTEQLRQAGFSEEQAKGQAKALATVIQKVEESRMQELATKGDVESAKVDMIKWTAGMFAAQTALILGAMFAIMRINQPPPIVYQSPAAQELRQMAPQPAVPPAR